MRTDSSGCARDHKTILTANTNSNKIKPQALRNQTGEIISKGIKSTRRTICEHKTDMLTPRIFRNTCQQSIGDHKFELKSLPSTLSSLISMAARATSARQTRNDHEPLAPSKASLSNHNLQPPDHICHQNQPHLTETATITKDNKITKPQLKMPDIESRIGSGNKPNTSNTMKPPKAKANAKAGANPTANLISIWVAKPNAPLMLLTLMVALLLTWLHQLDSVSCDRQLAIPQPEVLPAEAAKLNNKAQQQQHKATVGKSKPAKDPIALAYLEIERKHLSRATSSSSSKSSTNFGSGYDMIQRAHNSPTRLDDSSGMSSIIALHEHRLAQSQSNQKQPSKGSRQVVPGLGAIVGLLNTKVRQRDNTSKASEQPEQATKASSLVANPLQSIVTKYGQSLGRLVMPLKASTGLPDKSYLSKPPEVSAQDATSSTVMPRMWPRKVSVGLNSSHLAHAQSLGKSLLVESGSRLLPVIVSSLTNDLIDVNTLNKLGEALFRSQRSRKSLATTSMPTDTITSNNNNNFNPLNLNLNLNSNANELLDRLVSMSLLRNFAGDSRSTAPSVYEKSRINRKLKSHGLHASGIKKMHAIDELTKNGFSVADDTKTKDTSVGGTSIAKTISNSNSNSNTNTNKQPSDPLQASASSNQIAVSSAATSQYQAGSATSSQETALTTSGGSKIKPRGIMWEMATDPSLAVTVFHLLERASVALPLGFLLMPFVKMMRSPTAGINFGGLANLANLLPPKASHRSVDIEELAKRIDLVDKMLSRALRSTHRESYVG